MAETDSSSTSEVRLWEMSWPEIQQARDAGKDVVILPVGSFEQHGPHLPILTDTLVVQWVAEQTAQRMGNAVVAPPVSYGVSTNHIDFPGTTSLSPDTLKRLVVDIGTSILSHGFRSMVLLNGHGGNMAALGMAAQELRERTGKVIVSTTWPFVVKEAWSELECEVVWHADEQETSVMLVVAPDKVNMDKAVRELPRPVPGFVFHEEALAANTVDRGLPRTKDVSDSGTIGDATLATTAKGERILAETVTNLAKQLTAVLGK